MKHAITILTNALDVVETNEPINRREGNFEQADLEFATANEIRLALQILQHYNF